MGRRIVVALILISLMALPLKAFAASQVFYIDSSYDISGRALVGVVLKTASSKAHFYVEESYLNSLTTREVGLFDGALQNLSSEFNETIYPRMTSVYGSAGLEKVTVLATPMKEGYRGYFREENEMIYLNARDITSSLAPAFLAHEFQHLINFNLKGGMEERWLNEALSEYAPTLCGYNDEYQGSYLSERVRDFIQSPYDPLGEWKESPADYASVNLFIHYLVGRFGEDLITKIITNNKVGIASIEQAVADLGYSLSFENIFADWTVANYLNDAELSESALTYNPNCCGELTYDKFHISSQVTYGIYPASETGSSFTVKDWAGSWYKFIPTGRLGPGRGDVMSIEFNTENLSSNFKARVIISDFEGNNEIRNFYIKGGKGKFYVPYFGWKKAQVIFIPFNSFKKSSFSAFDPQASFSFTARSEFIGNPAIDGNLWPEGSLIRAKGASEVYIIKDGFKRWIQTPELFNMYGHFKWGDIIEAAPENVSSHQDAWLVRKAGGVKVYEVNGDGTKHWLNMTAEEFEISGRKWGMIYEVNESEIKWYNTGVDVMYR